MLCVVGVLHHQIIGFRKLRKNYKTFEAKRKLAQSYTMFLADDSIIPMLSKYLGKEFFSRKKCVALPSWPPSSSDSAQMTAF
jgi:ribosome biogenesis protein UTP30